MSETPDERLRARLRLVRTTAGLSEGELAARFGQPADFVRRAEETWGGHLLLEYAGMIADELNAPWLRLDLSPAPVRRSTPAPAAADRELRARARIIRLASRLTLFEFADATGRDVGTIWSLEYEGAGAGLADYVRGLEYQFPDTPKPPTRAPNRQASSASAPTAAAVRPAPWPVRLGRAVWRLVRRIAGRTR